MRIVSAKWREMPDTEKNTYKDKAAQHTILLYKQGEAKKYPKQKPINGWVEREGFPV